MQQNPPSKLSTILLANCAFVKDLNDLLLGLSMTNKQGKDIAKLIIDGVVDLERPECPKEAQAVRLLFNPENIERISTGMLCYYGMVDKLKEANISQSSKSRIYHTIANIKKEPTINENQLNNYGVMCVRTNGYKELCKSELEEIIKYETIAEKIRQIGENVKSKLESIRKYSEKINHAKKQNALSFPVLFQEAINQRKGQILNLNISVDPILQDLISVAFDISAGRWNENVGKIINQALKKDTLSPQLKSSILSIFFDKFYLPTEIQGDMRNFYINSIHRQQKIFIQEYMRQLFQIQQAFKYTTQNHRIYHRAQQLKQIVICKNNGDYYAQTQYIVKFVENLVIEGHCLQKVKSLKELFHFYVKINKQNSYFQWIQNQFSIINQNPSTQILKNEIYLLKAEQLIIKNQLEQAADYIYDAMEVFKGQENHQKQMECSVLLAEHHIKTNNHNLKRFIEYYEKKVIKRADSIGVQLRGALYAGSVWRVQNYLWEKYQKNNERCQILKTFTLWALQQMSRSKGEQFIDAITKKWKQYDMSKMKRPQIKQGNKIRKLTIRFFQVQQCRILGELGYRNLTILNLYSSSIGAEGCAHLCKIGWNNMKSLNLSGNNIRSEGCLYLSKAGWKNITTISLDNNKIEDEGCQYLSKAGWNNLETLNLSYNAIGHQGCLYLSKSDWKKITSLNLYDCSIGAEGCMHLSTANWPSLTILYLIKNNIGAQGCHYLSKADWKNMTLLCINQNSIGSKGCLYLIKANWQNITVINLNKNNIGTKGCQHLSKGKWQNLTKLYLNKNQVNDQGCLHLSKASWRSMISLILSDNNIEALGFFYLTKANWKGLTSLNLEKNYLKQKNAIKRLGYMKELFIQKGLSIVL